MQEGTALLLALSLVALPLAAATQYTTHSLALANPPHQGGLAMDYIAYDRATGMVWAPVSNTGTLYIVDTTTEDVKPIEGLATKEVEFRSNKRASVSYARA